MDFTEGAADRTVVVLTTDAETSVLLVADTTVVCDVNVGAVCASFAACAIVATPCDTSDASAPKTFDVGDDPTMDCIDAACSKPGAVTDGTAGTFRSYDDARLWLVSSAASGMLWTNWTGRRSGDSGICTCLDCGSDDDAIGTNCRPCSVCTNMGCGTTGDDVGGGELTTGHLRGRDIFRSSCSRLSRSDGRSIFRWTPSPWEAAIAGYLPMAGCITELAPSVC